MKVLITGSQGQLGKYLTCTAPKYIGNKVIELIQPKKSELNLADPQNCILFLEKNKPNWIINAAAFTNVDQSEQCKKLTYNINSIAPKIFSEWVLNNGGNLLQISTDYVFDGLKSSPYVTTDITNPIGVYGASKEAAEKFISNILFPTNQANILRSSWLIGPGQNNFAHKMINLCQDKDKVEVVYDQISCPTNVIDLAFLCWQILKYKEEGVEIPKLLHWSDFGVASWFDLAESVAEIGYDLGLISSPVKIVPIKSEQFPSLAKRPAFSLLDISQTIIDFNFEPNHWRSSLKEILKIKSEQ